MIAFTFILFAIGILLLLFGAVGPGLAFLALSVVMGAIANAAE